MKRDAFDQLVRSVRQAGRIRRGLAKPARALAFESVGDVDRRRRRG